MCIKVILDAHVAIWYRKLWLKLSLLGIPGSFAYCFSAISQTDITRFNSIKVHVSEVSCMYNQGFASAILWVPLVFERYTVTWPWSLLPHFPTIQLCANDSQRVKYSQSRVVPTCINYQTSSTHKEGVSSGLCIP